MRIRKLRFVAYNKTPRNQQGSHTSKAELIRGMIIEGTKLRDIVSFDFIHRDVYRLALKIDPARGL